MNLAEITDALAAEIRQSYGAGSTRPTTVYTFDPGPTRSYPCIIVEPGEPFVEYHTTMANECNIALEVTVAVSARTIDEQVAIYDYCSDGDEAGASLRRAIEDGRNTTTGGLGGLVLDFVVDRAHKPAPDDTGALMARFDVRMSARRGGTP